MVKNYKDLGGNMTDKSKKVVQELIAWYFMFCAYFDQ